MPPLLKVSYMGKLADIKTKPTTASVEDFLDSVPDERKRNDSRVLLGMMEKAVKAAPKMWGGSIIGFGDKRYQSQKTGREVDWFIIGFSPRKAALTLYLGVNLQQHAEALKKLGKHKTGAGCLYIYKLEDVDLEVLEGIVAAAAK